MHASRRVRRAARPTATLTFSGEVELAPSGIFDLDLGDSTPGTYDRIVSNAGFRVGDVGRFDGSGTLRLRLAAGYNPVLGEQVPIGGYTTSAPDPGFNRAETNSALDYAWRFDPTQLVVFPAPRLTIEDASLIEGNSGTTQMTFTVRLSQPSANTVTVQVCDSDGTAVEIGNDYAAGVQTLTFTPGQVTRPALATIFGDTAVEADESFVLSAYRNRVQNAAFGNGLRGRSNGIGTIITDGLPPGTRYVLVGKDIPSLKIRRYTSTGTFLDTWEPFQATAR
jgi:hypothetical protein